MGDAVAVYTVLCREALPSVRKWRASLADQTEQGFNLFVSLDRIEREEVYEAADEEFEAVWLEHVPGETPAGILEAAVETLVATRHHVVFVDRDDVLFPTRVETAVRALRAYDVSGCTLEILTDCGCPTGQIFGLAQGERWEPILDRYNVFGLSNTAYRWEVLKDCLPLPWRCELVDWRLATFAWGRGARIGYDETPQMGYRPYSRNVAPVLPPFSTESVLASTRQVLGHYASLLENPRDLPYWLAERLHERSLEALRFRLALESEETLGQYVEALNGLEPKYVWWRCVAAPELEKLWKIQ